MTEGYAQLFDIQRNSCVDGPGIRTTVFFKGCNLKCRWCHNPESQQGCREFLFYKDKCTGCGSCKGVTPESTDFVCPNGAKVLCGKAYTPQQVLDTVLKDKLFFDASGGGVTFSGGECMLQPEVLTGMLRLCKENGIHTAVDTAGDVPFEVFQQVMPYTDLFLYDIKCIDAQTHLRYTGVSNRRILENLKQLLSCKPVWVRIPVIGGVNDTPEEMAAIRRFLDSCSPAQKVELMPYHALGEHKYAALGRAVPVFPVPTEETMTTLAKSLGI